MKCVNCGNAIPDKARFCPYCGTQNEPQQETTQNGQTTGQYQYQQPGQEAPRQANTVNLDSSLILKIGTAILGLIYVIFALRYVFNGVRTLLSVFSWGYATSIPGAVLTLISGACYGGMAALLVFIGFSKQREKAKSLFTVLGILGIAIIGIAFLRMLLFLVLGGDILFAIKMLLNPLFGTAAALAITYGLLYLTKEAPTVQDYQNMDSMSNMFKDCADAVQGAARDVASDVNAKADAYRSSKTSDNQNTGYQGQETAYTNYNTNYTGGNMNYSNGSPLKTDRGLLGYILLTMITCGIYSYYFIYTVARDVNTACEGDGKSTGGLLQFILLSVITCGIYSWIWQYSLGNRLAANAPRYGMNFQENGTTVLLWDLFGIFLCGIGPFIAMNIIIKNTNSICMAYNRSKGFM